MPDVELLIAEPVRFEIVGGLAHVFARSGGENLRFAMPVLDFRATIAQGQVEIWKYEEAQKNVVPFGRGGKRR